MRTALYQRHHLPIIILGLVISVLQFSTAADVKITERAIELNKMKINVKKVTTGGYLTAVLSNSSEVYWWGLQRSYPLKIFENKDRITQLSCGGYHCLALSAEGQIYQWGMVNGVGTHLFEKPLPLEIPGNNIVKVAAGYLHNIAINDKGEVYSWGESSRGKLGHSEVTEGRSGPNKIELPLQVKIVDGCAGGDHTILLDEQRRLYSFGANSDGQLGMGHYDDLHLPSTYPIPLTEPIAKVVCGGDHSLALTEDNELYSWGWGELGQLGYGRLLENVNEPRKVNFGKERIVDVSAGGYGHTLILGEKGRVYGVGWGEAFGWKEGAGDVLAFIRVPGLSTAVELASGGYKHSAVLCRNGVLYLFGDNEMGQLGPSSASGESQQGPFFEGGYQEVTTGEYNNIHVFYKIREQVQYAVGFDSVKHLRPYQEDTAVVVPQFPMPSPLSSSFGLQSLLNELIEGPTMLPAQSPPSGIFLAIYDGHGGDKVSNYLATHMHLFVEQWMGQGRDAEGAMREAYQTVYERSLKTVGGEHEDEDGGMGWDLEGSTSVTCMLLFGEEKKGKVVCGNVGDSMAYVGNSKGEFTPLSQAHKPTDPNEYNRILQLGGRVVFSRVNGILAISRAFGDTSLHPYVITEPYITSHNFDFQNTEGSSSSDAGTDLDWLILGSDGLWDGISPGEAFQLLTTLPPSLELDGSWLDIETEKAKLYSELLIRKAKEGGSTDNITVIVLNLKSLWKSFVNKIN